MFNSHLKREADEDQVLTFQEFRFVDRCVQ